MIEFVIFCEKSKSCRVAEHFSVFALGFLLDSSIFANNENRVESLSIFRFSPNVFVVVSCIFTKNNSLRKSRRVVEHFFCFRLMFSYWIRAFSRKMRIA